MSYLVVKQSKNQQEAIVKSRKSSKWVELEELGEKGLTLNRANADWSARMQLQ